jgi:hypothetical protein
MRSLFAIAAITLLSACASQTPAPVPAKAEATPAAKKAPQCWNGDAGAFQDVGTKTTVSGVAVECKPTSDGKAAQWMGVNTKH